MSVQSSTLGSGKRFKELENKLEKKGVRNPSGLAAKIGREKYGKERFQEMAEKGKERRK